MWTWHQFCILNSFLLVGIFNDISSITIIEGGGYSIILCTDQYSMNDRMFNGINLCINENKTCEQNGIQFLCQLPCNFRKSFIKINRSLAYITYLPRPIFKLKTEKPHLLKSGDYLNITTQPGNLSLLEKDEIQIIFSRNISCSPMVVTNQWLSCKLDINWTPVGTETVNVSVKYGIECNQPNYIGEIKIRELTSQLKLLYYLLIIVIIISIVSSISVFLFQRKRLKTNINYEIFFQIQKQEQEHQFVNIQRKGLVEYQNKTKFFKNLGKLTPRHLLSFNEYMNRNFKVSFIKKQMTDRSDISFHFERMLLEKFQLMDWINCIEWRCQIQERTIVASFLTIYLFQYPQYLLELMKTMLIQLIFETKKNSDERTLFLKPESIAELIVKNWLTICMYENFKTGKEGLKLFNLYRALKCQINSGLVDEFSKKSQYSLSLDYLLPGDFDCDTLNVLVSVNVQIKMMDSSISPLTIIITNIPIVILSLDTVSQVKAKILDRVLMMHVKDENCTFTDPETNQTIAQINPDNFLLYFFHNKIKIILADFDKTSILPRGKKEFIIANTMKHYNIKSGNKLLLLSDDLFNYSTKHPFPEDYLTKIHLLIPNDPDILSTENKNISREKLIFQPAVNVDNNSSLFILLATKKNVNFFINSLFKSITKDKDNNNFHSSNSSYQKNQERKFFQVHYLFSMLDDIGTSISINDSEEVKSWKINCFINAFWSNSIRNPNQIFSVEVDPSLSASLQVISEILQISCSQENSISFHETVSSISTQMFHEDIATKYKQWWNSFLNSKRKISEEDIVSLMSDITKKYDLQEFKADALENLKMIGHKYLKQN